ncbi:hypothetical protein [Natronoglycomyces albus]|uniref:Uncharacterized protein n=1 Tax=Natronoglycomyces albus TaxID=2811108 RepID=A0A895XV63_9ACTN|nr:hypothetical protein [Natronoglycomyces albus]QSB07149.1 hypothetical protein JQS30_17045 [Natronoglycomyces albus]
MTNIETLRHKAKYAATEEDSGLKSRLSPVIYRELKAAGTPLDFETICTRVGVYKAEAAQAGMDLDHLRMIVIMTLDMHTEIGTLTEHDGQWQMAR